MSSLPATSLLENPTTRKAPMNLPSTVTSMMLDTSSTTTTAQKRLSPRLDRLLSMPNRKMLTLLNTIRKKDSINTQEPLDEKTKRVVIGEWKKILMHSPELFMCAWQRSAGRSASIKKTFVNVDASDDEVKIGFSELSGVIQNFFNKIILVQQLDETQMRITCEALGARHIDFVSRGFNSAFWDVFLVCMGEVLSEVLISYTTDAGRRAEIGMACERVFATTVHYMRTGYQDRRRREAKSNEKSHDHSPS